MRRTRSGHEDEVIPSALTQDQCANFFAALRNRGINTRFTASYIDQPTEFDQPILRILTGTVNEIEGDTVWCAFAEMRTGPTSPHMLLTLLGF